MPFEVIWTARSRKDLKALDLQVAKKIFEKVDSLNGKETVFLEKLKGKDFYKFRIGAYRVLIDKFPAKKKLFVLRIGHRRNIYGRV